MPGATADTGMGCTLVLGTTAFTGRLRSFSWSGISREVVENNHMGLSAPSSGKFGNAEFLAVDIVDPGEVQFVVRMNTGQSGATAQPPIMQMPASETITVTWPKATGDSTAATWAGTGICTGVETGAEMNAGIDLTVTYKLTGNVTITAAA